MSYSLDARSAIVDIEGRVPRITDKEKDMPGDTVAGFAMLLLLRPKAMMQMNRIHRQG